jgi:hypothetical protein
LNRRLWHTEVPLTPSFEGVEYFEGEMSVTKGLMEKGFRTASLDYIFHPSMNMNTPAGFASKALFFECDDCLKAFRQIATSCSSEAILDKPP